MAYLSVKEGQIVSATKDLVQLLGYDPTDQPLHTVLDPAQAIASSFVTIYHRQTNERLMLCVCAHPDDGTIVCSDTTVLGQLYETGKVLGDLAIARLTPYGTIDAFFCADALTAPPTSWTGVPIMRFVHPDDVQPLCAGLSQATGQGGATFKVRCQFFSARPEDDDFDWYQVMAVTLDQEMLCIIRPTTPDPEPVHVALQPCGFSHTLAQVNQRFWSALDSGRLALANLLATGLVILVQTVSHSWKLFSHDGDWIKVANWLDIITSPNSAASVVRSVVQTAKSRPEIDRFCTMIEWTGLVESGKTKSLLNKLFDHGSEWLIAKTIQHACDGIV
ncbi:hypothetical protein EC973_009361 [Apophysomyces ossiformis]|uniref:Uncharacterized protein n=1 Tax=Apophysomyces ossiformis TaxID=679940 RepID=A0A8H7BUU9_9FUNG|nr:hypothetical protein EC973_009361 [Apophysomyces ossiformis]